MSADPYIASGGASAPSSWNRFAYVEGDPVNYRDSRGLESEGPSEGLVFCVYLGTHTTQTHCDLAAGGDPNGNPPTKVCRDGSVRNLGEPCPDELYAAGSTPPPNKGGWTTNPAGVGKTAWQYLTSIWEQCLNDFKRDKTGRFSSDALSELLTDTIQWWDTRGYDGNRTVNEVVNNGDTRTLRGVVGSSSAVVLGDFSPNVALGINYFQDNTQTTQIAVAVHEALHIQLRMGDAELKGWLSNFGFKASDYGTGDITDWIATGCAKK